MGYHNAGFEVVGVDIEPQPHYPFEFHICDAIEFIAKHGHEFDVIHASPPCQRYSQTRFLPGVRRHKHPDMIPPTRAALRSTGKPYIIENVRGAPLISPIRLSGPMFGIGVIRVRLFETNPFLLVSNETPKPPGRNTAGRGDREYGQNGYVTVAGRGFNKQAGARAMGIDWMTRDELSQAIPPAYTEYLGRLMIAAIEGMK